MKMTASLKVAEAKHEWVLLDAADATLGRLSTQIATLLRGKHKPTFTPHTDNGAHVVVINAAKVRLTGHKRQNEVFRYYTGHIGGLREVNVGKELDGKYPERVLERAVQRMLPKESPLARVQLGKLHVYGGAEHPHAAQQPVATPVASARTVKKSSK